MNIHRIKSIKLDSRTAYLAGYIAGDGHISSSNKSKTDSSKDYRIAFDTADIEHLESIHSMIKEIISTNSRLGYISSKGNKRKRAYLHLRNKSLYHFFTEVLGIPKGKKSKIIYIPENIKKNKLLLKWFIAGFFDADWGFRGNSLGFTSASLMMIKDIGVFLKKEGYGFVSESWHNKRYGSDFYGIKLHKDEIDRFLNEFPLQNQKKLTRIITRYVEVPEWPNGLDGH